MTEDRKHYREAFLKVKLTLQDHDPFGVMGRYRGDRVSEQLYAYEATTLLERLRTKRAAADVRRVLSALASEPRVDPIRLTSAAEAVADVLKHL